MPWVILFYGLWSVSVNAGPVPLCQRAILGDPLEVMFFLPSPPGDGLGDVAAVVRNARAFHATAAAGQFRVRVLLEDRKNIASDALEVLRFRNSPFKIEVAGHHSTRDARLRKTPVAVHRLAACEGFRLGKSRINIYMPEPGCYMEVPDVFRNLYVIHPNQRMYFMEDGKVHVWFDPSRSYNFHRSPVDLLYGRSRIVDTLYQWFPEMVRDIPYRKIRDAEWALVYHHRDSTWDHYGIDGYYTFLDFAVAASDQLHGAVIFDFSDQDGYAGFEPPEGTHLNHLFEEGAILSSRSRSATVLHLGSLPRKYFLSVLNETSLPNQVTGTSSFEEAVAMQKMFFLERQLFWKVGIVEDVFRSLLEGGFVEIFQALGGWGFDSRAITQDIESADTLLGFEDWQVHHGTLGHGLIHGPALFYDTAMQERFGSWVAKFRQEQGQFVHDLESAINDAVRIYSWNQP